MRDNLPQNEAQAAFVAAALVLLVLPLVVVIGLAAIALTWRLSVQSSMVDVNEGTLPWYVLTLFGVWVLLAVVSVLVFAIRFSRRRSG